MPGSRLTYVAHVVPGLESITAFEIGRRVSLTGPIRSLSGFDDRTSLLTVPYAGDAAELLALRTLEDLFILAVDQTDVPGNWAGLRTVQAAIDDSRTLERAAALVLESHGRRARKPSFRVVARLAGEHAFRRVDLHDAVEKALRRRFTSWQTVEENADLETWVHLVEGHLILAIRLSGGELRHRTYKRVSLPASLKPTIAAAMVLISQPRPDDVLLDPMCGAGTILIERGEDSRYARLLGGDLDPHALDAARVNIGPRYQPIELRRWDARTLPLDDRSVTAVVSNLPFGHRIGSEHDNLRLYPALLAEWSRVLAPSGRVVLLTSESRLLASAVRRLGTLRLVQRLPVIVRGMPAAIHLLHPTASRG